MCVCGCSEKVGVIHSLGWDKDLDLGVEKNLCTCACAGAVFSFQFQSLISKDKYLPELLLSCPIMKIFAHTTHCDEFCSLFSGCTIIPDVSEWPVYQLLTHTEIETVSFTHTHTHTNTYINLLFGAGNQRPAHKS